LQQEFLADYGMIWVGPEADHDNEDEDWTSKLEKQQTGGTSTHSFWNPGMVNSLKVSFNNR
jgi:hypothetical protein